MIWAVYGVWAVRCGWQLLGHGQAVKSAVQAVSQLQLPHQKAKLPANFALIKKLR